MTTTMDHRELLIKNRDTVSRVFKWDTGLMHLCCANIYTMRGIEADLDSLKQTRAMFNSRVSGFSNFHATAKNALITMLDASGKAEDLLDRALRLYDLLKKRFFTSSYLPLAAMLLAEHSVSARWDELVARTRTFYERMSKEHPWLTSFEDDTLCALLSMSEQSDDDLIGRMEQCYTTFKGQFPLCGNQVQALSQVLAMYPGSISAKCDRVLALRDALKAAGHKWSNSYEIPVLGILAEDPRTIDELVADICANDDWLAGQKGFGFFSTVSRMQRLMYAALLTQSSAAAATTAAINSTLATVVAQQTALIATMSATAAAASSHH